MVDACCWERIAENPFYDMVFLIWPNCVLGTFLGTRLGTDLRIFSGFPADNRQIALRWSESPFPLRPEILLTLLPPPKQEIPKHGEAVGKSCKFFGTGFK